MSRFENLTIYQIQKAFEFIFYTEDKMRANPTLSSMECHIKNIPFNSSDNIVKFTHIIIDYYCKRDFVVNAFVQSQMIVFKFIFKTS